MKILKSALQAVGDGLPTSLYYPDIGEDERELGVAYENTSDNPIVVCVTMLKVGAGNAESTIGFGESPDSIDPIGAVTSVANGGKAVLQAIIPAHNFFIIESDHGVIDNWVEYF